MTAVQCISTSVITNTSTTSVTFSNIPPIYDSLQIIGRGGAASTATISLHINGDITQKYSRVYLGGNGSAGYSGVDTNGTALTVAAFFSPGNDSFTTYLFGVSNTTTSTTFMSMSNLPANGPENAVGVWDSTAVVNSITVTTGGTIAYLPGTSISLWGVR